MPKGDLPKVSLQVGWTIARVTVTMVTVAI